MSVGLDFSDFGSEDDLAGFDYPKPGQYHLVVISVDDSFEKVDGIKFGFQVLHGNVEGQKGKEFNEVFFNPSADAKDGGKFATKRMAKMALALGLIQPNQLGQPNVVIPWKTAEGRQFVATLAEYKREKDGKTYKGAQTDGLHMYRVNDPAVAEVPKDAEALKLIEGGAPVPPQQQPPAAGGSSFDNI